jgi:hypothetical protein
MLERKVVVRLNKEILYRSTVVRMDTCLWTEGATIVCYTKMEIGLFTVQIKRVTLTSV